MKIFAVSQFYSPDITAAAFRISETVSDLKDMGHDVEVVTTFPHKSDDGEKVPASENGVHRVKLPDTENKGFLGYIYLYLSFMLKSIFKGLVKGYKLKPDVVWASSPPIFVGIAGWVLAKLLGAHFALDVRDIWPDSAVAAGQISSSGFAYKVGRLMELFLYKNADMISCVATPMKEYIKEFTNTEVEVIYNGVEVSASTNSSTIENGFKSFRSNGEVKKLLYAGNFGHVQQLDLLIKVYANLDEGELDQDWELYFLGGGAQKDNLIRLAESYDLQEKIHFLDPVPKKEVFGYLNNADALFIHLQDSEVLRLTIPSKVFDYMLANRPLLCGIYGEGREIVGSIEGNVVFNSGDKESLEKAFLELDQLITHTDNPDNADIVKNKFSRKGQSEKLNSILQKKFS